MAKRKQRKSEGKAGKTPQISKLKTKSQSKHRSAAPARPTAAATEAAVLKADPALTQPQPATVPAGLPNAATLLDELQQRCESLRQWQRQANEDVQSRLTTIEKRERELDESARQMEHDRTHLDLDMDATKRARLMLDKEKAQAEQTQQALEVERQHLVRARAELSDQKQELQNLRGEMDAEWASLARVRRAQDSLAAALDTDRARVQELRLADGLGVTDGTHHDTSTDETPGLSLTQAA